MNHFFLPIAGFVAFVIALITHAKVIINSVRKEAEDIRQAVNDAKTLIAEIKQLPKP